MPTVELYIHNKFWKTYFVEKIYDKLIFEYYNNKSMINVLNNNELEYINYYQVIFNYDKWVSQYWRSNNAELLQTNIIGTNVWITHRYYCNDINVYVDENNNVIYENREIEIISIKNRFEIIDFD
jgi:hypothetical protein